MSSRIHGEAGDLCRPPLGRRTDRRSRAGRGPRSCASAGLPRATRRAPVPGAARRRRHRLPPVPTRPPASARSGRLRRRRPGARRSPAPSPLGRRLERQCESPMDPRARPISSVWVRAKARCAASWRTTVRVLSKPATSVKLQFDGGTTIGVIAITHERPRASQTLEGRRPPPGCPSASP